MPTGVLSTEALFGSLIYDFRSPIIRKNSCVTAYYKLRFQIEFLFRDAKQFTGLPVCVHRTGRCDCQARDQKRLDFHFNASLTTLNLAKAELTLTQENDQSVICSMASVKALYFNQH